MCIYTKVGIHFKTRSHRRIIFVETGGKETPIQFHFQPGDLLVLVLKLLYSKRIDAKEIEQK